MEILAFSFLLTLTGHARFFTIGFVEYRKVTTAKNSNPVCLLLAGLIYVPHFGCYIIIHKYYKGFFVFEVR